MLMVLVSRFPSPRGNRKAGDFQFCHQSIRNPRMHWEEPPDTKIACKERSAHTCACTSLHSHVSVCMCVCVHRRQCGHAGVPANPLPGMPMPAEGPGSARKDWQREQPRSNRGRWGRERLWGLRAGDT